MFMSTDAARKMKTATDALGVSIEEIVWGPPELAERYRQLIKDQNQMLQALGSADFEKQMRNLRDMRFEFTRMGVEMKYFSMLLVKDLSRALFGSDDGLLKALQKFNNWFMNNMPRISQTIAAIVAPAFREMGVVLGHFGESMARIDWEKILGIAVKLSTVVLKILDFIASNPKLIGAIAGAVPYAAVGGLAAGPWGALGGGIAGAITGAIAGQKLSKPSDRAVVARQAAANIAGQLGVDPSWVYGQFVHETAGFTNRGAMDLNNLAGIKMPGGKDYRKFASMQEFADYYTALLRSSRYAGAPGAKTDADFFKALKSGGYYEDSYDNYLRGSRRGEPQYKPLGFSYNGGSHSITVNVGGSNASADEIARSVEAAVERTNAKQNQRLLAQRQGVYA
jgi:hypothetical protein